MIASHNIYSVPYDDADESLAYEYEYEIREHSNVVDSLNEFNECLFDVLDKVGNFLEEGERLGVPGFESEGV